VSVPIDPKPVDYGLPWGLRRELGVDIPLLPREQPEDVGAPMLPDGQTEPSPEEAR
jgi:hypothetical protein